MKNKITIGSSIITMDHLNFERDVKLAEELGVDFLHVDVMDSKLVPRIGIYPEIVEQIAQISPIKIDVHLMIEKVEWYINNYSNIPNIEYISFHADENTSNIFRIVDTIKNNDKKALIVLNLSSDIYRYCYLIEHNIFDGIVLMGIHPGVLCQTPKPEIVINNLKIMKEKIKPHLIPKFIQVDGAVNFETIPFLVKNGATNLVCGSSTIYKDIDFRSLSNEKIKNKVKKNYSKIKALLNGV